MDRQRLSAVTRRRGACAVARATLSAASAWQGLIRGHYFIVDWYDLGGRRYLVTSSSPRPPAPPLTSRQRLMLAQRARGAALKVIAFEVGVSSGTVSRDLSVAMERLGLESAADLAAVFGHAEVEVSPSGRRANLPPPRGLEVAKGGDGEALVLSFTLGDLAPPSGLTQCEREVVQAALRGLTNSDIARSRGVSPRTVANQLAHVFAKLGVGSRLELALRWHQEAPATRSSAGAAA